jgi:hypothetical protein
VVGRNLEVEFLNQGLLKATVDGSWDLRHPPATLANQVKVILAGKVVDGWAVPEVSVFDDALAFEGIQRPVDSRRGDLWMLTVDAVGQFLGGHVARSL